MQLPKNSFHIFGGNREALSASLIVFGFYFSSWGLRPAKFKLRCDYAGAIVLHIGSFRASNLSNFLCVKSRMI